VLVGDTTRQQCSDTVHFEAHQVAVLRGREQPETIWLAVTADHVPRRQRRRTQVPLVGRTAERGLLRGVVGRVLAGQSAVVSVVGEAGIGKTSLVDDLLESFRAGVPEVAVFEAACAPYGETSPWSPLAVAVSSWLGLDRGDPPDRIRHVAAERAVSEGLDPGDPDVGRMVEAMLHLLGQPSELDRLDPTGVRDAVTTATVNVLRRRAAIAPVVLWIDDLQYSHAPLRELLRTVVRNLAGHAFLLVVAYRSGEEVDWPPVAERSLVLTLPLGPLDHDESSALVERITGGAVEPDLAEQLYHRSGGNPLFLTELARLAAAGASDDAELPGSLRALIAAQLDQLPSHLRAIVDNAAVLGTEGPISSLATFASALDQPWDPAGVDDLVAAGFLEVEDGWWAFRSDVVRDVAYGTLTKRSRAQRHAGVATVMARSGKAPVHDLAAHAATAAELLNELGPVTGVLPAVGDLAVDALSLAAQQSFDLGGHRRVISQTSRALALTDDPSTRRTLLLLRASASVELRQLDTARADLDEVLDSAIADGDRVAEGEVHRLAGMIHQLDGDLVTARRRLGESVDVFREIGDEEHLANSLRSRGFAEVLGGSLDVAERYLDEAEEIYRRLDLPRGIAWIEQNRAWVAFLSGDLPEARRRLDTAIAAFHELRDQGGVTWARGLLAFVMYMERRFAEAEAMSDEVLIEARRWGDEWGASMMLALGSALRLWTGRFAESVQYGERALQGFRRLGDRFGVMQALAPLGRARAALGRVAEVERGSEELLAVGDAFGDLAFPAIAAAGAAMHLGQGVRARKLADEAVERMGATGADLDEARMLLALAQCQTGDADLALATLLHVAVPASPFATSVRAVAHAMVGDLEAALADADATAGFDRPSYFDRALAEVVAAAVAHRLGAPDSSERLVRMLTDAEACGDVQLTAVARATARRLGINDGGGEPALAAGWRTVVAGITGVDVDPAA
jgi:tetratricopeptide (TPR) repeat protein